LSIPLVILPLALSKERLESSRRDMLGRAIMIAENKSSAIDRSCLSFSNDNVQRISVGLLKWFVVLLSLCWWEEARVSVIVWLWFWRIYDCAESEAGDKARLGYVDDDECLLRVFQVCFVDVQESFRIREEAWRGAAVTPKAS